MTLRAAAAKLGSFVKGTLIGIRVTRTGTSPRILTAAIVGTRGTVTVTGLELQHAFGLLTTLARFTTITSGMTAPDARAVRAALQVPGDASLISALVLVPALTGRVFPAPGGAPFALQVQGKHGWRTLSHYTLGRDGTYSVELPVGGTYRVTYRGLAGPGVVIP
jgi:hypothetical protein